MLLLDVKKSISQDLISETSVGLYFIGLMTYRSVLVDNMYLNFNSKVSRFLKKKM